MLLNELVKSGPLAKIWLSAHQEKKLSKAQALGVDVGESVDAILTQDAAQPLRSSGPLMLGVVRIYSRKVGYLFDDCKEARERISLAFRPGIVDLPEDQLRASKNAITFPDVRNEFDFLDWSWTGPSLGAPEAPSAEAAINLPRPREFGAYNFGRPAAPSIYGGSTAASRASQDLGESALDSNDFSGIDLGLNLEGEEGDITMEAGRDVMTPMSRFSRERSLGLQKRASSRDSVGLGSIQGGDMGIEPLDLGLDFDNLDQPLPELEIREEDRSRRESSALSTPPPLSPPPISADTAAQIAAAPQAAPKAKKPRLVQADAELELPDEQRDLSAILGEERYIPSDPEAVRLQEIMADPSAHFLPIIKVGGENMIFAGPQGLAPELAELFTFPSNVLRRSRGTDEEGDRASKRPRLAGEEEEEVEAGRRVERGSEVPFEMPSGYGMEGMGGDDSFAFQPEELPYEEPLLTTPRAQRVVPREREPSIAPSRAESIAREIQYGGEAGEFTLSMFDSRTSAAAREEFSQLSQSQLSTPTKGSEKTTASGFSKNTSMAMGLLRKEIDAIEEEDKVVSFDKLAEKSTKRAASSFFFELLVLGTRDCVKLEQTSPYQDIKVRGKEKLWPEGEGEGLGEGGEIAGVIA
ncbi:hypothetical protein I302_100720 [Kwoniella bestiolae CBS 10118]|uniref:Cohesin complex subunit SCC1 n=1 Tax=Kwoniella bestiolae CBS 10118 TaxID=1296100 RepID=A0A1B9G5Y4_9TREE|nr:hypothetical protein I302_04095 [Kwoniella bestiolae CBS 10118]OCF26411.1 hypothetical protein I302_04095 [Kwoniella bestiolae CBS 10118]